MQTSAEAMTLNHSMMASGVKNSLVIKYKPKFEPEYKTSHSMVVGDVAGEPRRGYFELIGAGSLSAVDAGDGLLGVTSSETDTLVQTNENDWNSWGGQFGVGYVYFRANAQKYAERTQWFPMIEPEVNVYYNRYQNKGDVYRFGSPTYNELTYNMSINSTRLMLDGALTVVSKRQWSTYVIGGIGNAWSRVKYSDSDKSGDPCVLANLSLNGHDSSRFVWEVGAGEAYDVTDKVRISFQYLYTDFGHITTSGHGQTGTITTPLLIPASFNLQAQALLLGLHVKV